MSRHKRSAVAIQRRLAKRFILANSFHDRELKEDININTPEEISTFLTVTVAVEDPIIQEVPSQYIRGEVLSDGYGRGTFQR